MTAVDQSNDAYEGDDRFQVHSRREVLARQIDSAIWLLCIRGQPIVANLVANAAIDVLRSLCAAAEVQTFKGRLEDHVKPEHLTEWREYDRRAYNHSKHADRDPAADIRFNPDQADINVLAAIVDFGQLFRRNTAFMTIFRGFELSKRPETLLAGDFQEMHKEFAARIAADFPNHSHDEARREMLIAIDQRPALVAGWTNLEVY